MRVSVLFSEPKIPQSVAYVMLRAFWLSFSALQRAENSSIVGQAASAQSGALFQCSSASRKFLNGIAAPSPSVAPVSFSALQRAENSSIFPDPCAQERLRSFSALQRAENSSIDSPRGDQRTPRRFQCSSASRKFLNIRKSCQVIWVIGCFSALQRAENSSIRAR